MLNEPKVSPYNCWHLLLGDVSNNLLYHKKIKYEFYCMQTFTLNLTVCRTSSTLDFHDTVTLPPPKVGNHELTALLLNDEYSKCETLLYFTFIFLIAFKSGWILSKLLLQLMVHTRLNCCLSPNLLLTTIKYLTTRGWTKYTPSMLKLLKIFQVTPPFKINSIALFYIAQ
jgi:hypothetical protein